MKPVTSIRLPAELKSQLQQLAEADNRTLSNYIIATLEESAVQYRLEIYTYNAMEGINPEVRVSMHKTPRAAEVYLFNDEQPYAYAVLSRRSPRGYEPCDWDGNFTYDGPWIRRMGNNGSHPDVVALRSALSRLANEVRQRWQRSGDSMVEIASSVLKEQFPSISGYSERLAIAAYETKSER